jgi:DNA polymerase-3 subunit alpha
MNHLWLDTETTGLSEYKNDIVQLACIPIVNGIPQKPFNEFCQPTNWNAIEAEAVRVHGITRDMMETFQTQEEMLDKFIQYVSSFGVKFTIAGYNVGFDKKFISATFSKHGKSSDFFRLFTINIHDTYKRAKSVKSQIPVSSFKLESLADYYGIKIKAHDALSDIEATIAVDKIVSKLIGEDNTVYVPSMNARDVVISSNIPEMAQLNVHSQYNMVDGVPLPDEWYKWAAENNVPGVAVVDQGIGISLFDSIRNKHDTIAVSGITLNAIPGDQLVLEMLSEEKAKAFRLTAWALNEKGYENLVKLSSLGYDESEEINGINTPLLTIEQVKEHKEGLAFGTGGINGAIGQAIQAGDKQLAEQRYLELVNDLKEVYLEFNPIDITQVFDSKIGFRNIKNNDLVPDGNLGKALNNFYKELVDKWKAPAIPITAACFIDSADKIVQDCLSKNAHKDGKFYHEEYVIKKSEQVYRELKVHLGDWLTEERFISWVNNANNIVERAKGNVISFQYHLPEIQIPDYIKAKTDDYDMQTYYYMMEKIKGHGRWNDSPEYRDRFKRELDVIMKNKTMNFIPYFLVYEDVSTYSRDEGFLQSLGRGSAGGCLISYYLKIIHVDPVEAELPFERFLSHARIAAGSWPDIDMDISRTARPAVMNYLQNKYGFGFAQICTFSTMKTKNAIKDAMAAIYQRNRNDFEIKQLCDTIPDSPQGVAEKDFLYGYTDKEGEYHAGHIDENQMLQDFFNRYPDVQGLVDKLLGVVRGWSRHASAFVISTIKLRDGRVPTLKMYDNGMENYINVTQYDASMCEKQGLVKADLLGLNTMAMVTDCVHLLSDKIDYLEEDENGVALIYRLPELEGVYADFCKQRTDSSFQFNTNTVKAAVTEFIPSERKHLSIMTALLRPGAMDAILKDGVSATQWYMDVRMGKRDPYYIHPDLIPILEETYGIIVYQEQVMKILVDICGYTLEETDQIRSAIAKKKHEVMMAAFDRIREATAERGWTPEQSDVLCNTIQAFSRYSFNRSHSHCYAELGYITMYLKHNHPEEWWASVLNNEKSEDKIRGFISLLGEKVLPPSLKKPADKYVVDGKNIIAPISAIKRVGPSSVKELVEKGPFIDLEDYIKRVDHRRVNKGVIEALVKGRAADTMFDKSLPTYVDQKLDFLNRYSHLKGGKISWNVDVLSSDPMQIFFMEKEFNKTFNKNLLSDSEIRNLILSRWPSLQSTGRKGIPFMMGKTPVISSLKIAEGLIKNEHEQEVAMIMLFNGSKVRKGVSKRTGNDYCFLNINLSDGYNDAESVDWKRTKPLRYKENSIVYVRGTLKKGYRAPVSINLREIEAIE